VRALRERESGNEWQTLWFSTRKSAWSSLALVPSDGDVDVGRAAAHLVEAGLLHGERPVSLMDAQGIHLSNVQPFLDRLVDLVRRGEWVIVTVDSLQNNPAGLPIVRATSCALLVVRLGSSLLGSARSTIEALGRERLLGSVVIDVPHGSAAHHPSPLHELSAGR
jgi:hypothetical protein